MVSLEPEKDHEGGLVPQKPWLGKEAVLPEMREKQGRTSPNSLSCLLSFLLLSHGFLSAEPNRKSESGSPCDTICC